MAIAYEVESDSNLTPEEPILSALEIDTIGEVLNISMGSAATAISSMLDKQVTITTPKVRVETLDKADYSSLEPAMIVKITYVEGISGSNVMVFRQSDMQLILNQLMGVDHPPKDDFVFDELSMSAACEVMNQMMGASATALSEFLGKSINISTPTATIMDDDHTFKSAVGVDPKEHVVTVLFNLEIVGIMKTEFVSVIPTPLAKMIVGRLMNIDAEQKAAPTVQIPENTPPAAAMPPAAAAMPPQPQPPVQPFETPAQPAAQMPVMPPQPPMPPMQQPMQPQQPYAAQTPYYPQPATPYPPYPYPPQQPAGPNYVMLQNQPPNPGSNSIIKQQDVSVQNVQFPAFAPQPGPGGEPLAGGNMELIMNVPLSVSVEIGKTKRKIKEIMEFNQGTVIELEKQAGAPVDIVVNGQLMARGDVVVIDDNFGVRITEIVNVRDIVNTINNKNQ